MRLSLGESMELVSYLKNIRNLFPEYKNERDFMNVFMASNPGVFSELRTTHLLRMIAKARNLALSKGMSVPPLPEIFHGWEGASDDILSNKPTWDSFRSQPVQKSDSAAAEGAQPEKVEVGIEELSIYFDSVINTLGQPAKPGELEFLKVTIKSFSEALEMPVRALVAQYYPDLDDLSALTLKMPVDHLKQVAYGAFKQLMDMLPSPNEDEALPEPSHEFLDLIDIDEF